MKLLILLFFSLSFWFNNYAQSNISEKPNTRSLLGKASLKKIQAKYDTLIPIFEGLFVTQDSIDHDRYFSIFDRARKDFIWTDFRLDSITNKTRKWGVIDSTGKIIVPFICDGAKEISENKGVVSVYSHSYSLNTGIPRYVYFGKYFYFTKEGLTEEPGKDFSLRIELFSDFHHAEFIISRGPKFFLPKEIPK